MPSKTTTLDTTKPTAGRGLRERAMQEIRTRILDGTYPPGSPLSEYQLAADLNISRTPIREALRLLTSTGLVRVIRNRGAFVTELNVHDIVEVYQLRQLLEGFAAELAAEHMSDEQLRDLASTHQRALRAADAEDLRAAYDDAVRMHSQIVAAARNTRLADFLDRLADQTHRLGLLTLKSPGRVRDALREHGEIIGAITRRDGVQAAQLMRLHLESDRDTAVRQALPGSIGSSLTQGKEQP